MQRVGGRYIYSISDLNDHAGCVHLSSLERAVANKALRPPEGIDEALALIARKGDEHEKRYLAQLQAEHGDGVVLCDDSPAYSLAAMEERAAATLEAMRNGAQILYQPFFFDGVFAGRADFLRRVPGESRFGAWSYEAIDTKLAQRAKGKFLLQLCHYSEHIARVQLGHPQRAHIVLGSGAEKSFELADYSAYYRQRRAHFLQTIEDTQPTYPEQCAHCAICRWADACDAQRDADDHISLIAGMRKDAALKLQLAGITTVERLAHAADEERPPRLSRESFERLRAQAKLQHRQRVSVRAGGEVAYEYELLDAKPDMGFALLPEPDSGDIFFDIEGDPLYAPDRGLEYLFGFHLAKEAAFKPFWALSGDEERATFEAVVDFCTQRAAEYPNMRIYHYAPYEISALRRLSTRYGTREEEIDALLRANRFVDLYAVVRQGLRISQPSYSIKKLEPFYHMKRSTGVLRGDDSVVQFEVWLATKDDAILRDIEQYNTDDCYSTMLLRDWLLARKAEYVDKFGRAKSIATGIVTDGSTGGGIGGGASVDGNSRIDGALSLDGIPNNNGIAGSMGAAVDAGYPSDVSNNGAPTNNGANINGDASADTGAPTDKQLASQHAREERREIAAALLDGLSIDSVDALRTAPASDRARYLLAHFLEYHRREKKPAQWKHFDRIENKDTLVDEDHEALGELRLCTDIPPIPGKRGKLTYTYTFPEQQYNLGKSPKCIELGKATIAVGEIDESERRIQITFADSLDAASVRTLIPDASVRTEALEDVLLAGAKSWPLDAWENRSAARDILLAAPPRISGFAPGADIQPADVSADALYDIIAAMDRTCLVVQGPPGTGKTTKHAEVIVRLLQAGKTVGITASKHKAAHNLVAKIELVAEQRGFRFMGLHKTSKKGDANTYLSPLADPCVTSVAAYPPFAQPHTVAAGTQWAFAHFALHDFPQYDYLFVDEAGQISLADGVACAFSAKNVVLLGDPLQLAHVSQGEHPPGAAVSVLQHMLGADATIRADRGVFLDTSYRMSPAICSFLSDSIYESRLRSGENTLSNTVDAPEIGGSGLRFIPVRHAGNTRESREECAEILARVRDLLRGSVTIGRDAPRPMREADILIVAPYNSQRIAILGTLQSAGYAAIRVGTVDLFQGLEAAVVIYSMATSSGEIIPRGPEFLLDKNRFNVALSRAQCLAMVVASPDLLRMDCETPEHMALVNLLCRFVESAVTVEPKVPVSP